MAKIGDKYVIELDSHMTSKHGDLYGVKGFNALVFDDNGLNRLRKIRKTNEEAYQDGLNMAWMYARKIALNVEDGGMRDAFDVDTCYSIFIRYSAQEAIKKIEEYEKQKDAIKIGDELEQITNSGNPTGVSCIVTNIGDDKFNGITEDGKAVLCSSQIYRWWRKTGRTFPQIEEVLKAMQEETQNR